MPEHDERRPGLGGVAPVPCPEVSPGGVVAEGRIVEAVADGAVLSGTPAELSRCW